jgi:Lon protease-like protein
MMNIPLFPLGMTLFPEGVAALKIFEVRYLDMTRASFRDKVPFGIVTLDQGSEVREPTKQVSFAEIGTLAEIVEFEAVQPSLYAIRCRGQSRFKIDHSEQMPNGLWRVRPLRYRPLISPSRAPESTSLLLRRSLRRPVRLESEMTRPSSVNSDSTAQFGGCAVRLPRRPLPGGAA